MQSLRKIGRLSCEFPLTERGPVPEVLLSRLPIKVDYTVATCLIPVFMRFLAVFSRPWIAPAVRANAPERRVRWVRGRRALQFRCRA